MTDNTTSPPPPNPVSSNFFTSKPFIILVLTAIVLCGGIVLFKSLSEKTVLSFSFTIDGKSLSGDQLPDVKVDGQSFTSGSKINMGRRTLLVQLQNVEPFEKHFWVLFGAKNLGVLPLESSKGSLAVSVNPSPATVVVQRTGQTVNQGAAPLTLDKLPVGNYSLVIKRGEYEENRSIVIQRQKRTETKVDLNLGIVDLSAEPADAEFDLSGNGHHWQGNLPHRLDDVPVGDYSLLTRRKGWELNSTVSVSRGQTATNRMEFEYGSIDLTSDPAGLVISTNGVEIGKTPIIFHEIKPGQYSMTASDGDNDLTADVSVAPKEAAKHAFNFHYGIVQLSSTPAGATVIRKGKEIGKTPLTLNHIPAGETTVELQLQDYVPTNFSIRAVEGVTTPLSAQLVSERYLQAMNQARKAFGASQFDQAQKSLAAALVIQPDDSAAIQLRTEVAQAVAEVEKAKLKAAEAARVEQANAKAQTIASLPWLDFKFVISDCTDTRLVQHQVEKVNISYETYRDYDGKYKQREVKSAPYLVMETSTESTFNPVTFSEKYQGRTFRFNCPDQWAVSKVEKEGAIIFKGERSGSFGLSFHTINASPPANDRDAFKSFKKGQKITIKGIISKYTSGFLGPTLYLGNAEILTP